MPYCSSCGKQHSNPNSDLCDECLTNLRTYGTTNKQLIRAGYRAALLVIWLVSVIILISELVFRANVTVLGAGLFFGIIIAVVAGIVTYLDARKLNSIGKRKILRGGFWGLLSFIFAPLTMPVYFYRRNKKIRAIASIYGQRPDVSVPQAPVPGPSPNISVDLKLDAGFDQGISVGSVFDVRFVVRTNQEIRSVKFVITTSLGLVVLEYPKAVNIIAISQDGFVERAKARAVSYGVQSLKITVSGQTIAGNVERSSEIAIRVKAPAPNLQIAVKQYPAQVPFGETFSVVLNLRNIGQGAAHNLQLPTVGSLGPQLKPLQAFAQETILASGAVMDQPITFQAAKSGVVRMDGLLLQYKDMDNVVYTKEISSTGIKIEIFTPQPHFIFN